MTKHVVLRAGNGLLLNGASLGALLSGAVFGPIRMDAVAALEERREDLMADSQAIIAAADEAEIDLTDEETDKIEANAAEVAKIDRQIAARKALSPQGQGRKSTPEPQNKNGNGDGGQGRRVPAQPRMDNQRHGFASLGAFAMAVSGHYSRKENDEVTKLRNAATTYGNEGTGADGGFLVPPEFSEKIWQKVEAEENLLTRCAPLVTSKNGMAIPKDETTPWQSTGGIQVYWEGEGQAPAAGKPALELGTLRLAKLFGLVPISEELLDDAPGLESWLMVKAPSKMTAKINTSIIAGTGVGQPLGIIPGYSAVGASVVQVAKETSQPADTVWFANINKMWSRMYAGWRRNAIWLINQDVEPQLEGMAFVGNGLTPTAASSTPAYMPPGGVADAPYGRLKGRPVVPVEACAALGDLGDIILCDLMQYWALTKAGGITTDTSIHLYFDQALTAFRFIFRVNGQPAWSSTITRQNGSSNELSWAVALQAR
jgi:HK97 family phage major capsid protein